MTADPAEPADPVAEAAILIRDVGACTQRARRYRALATTVAEPLFDRALVLGSEVRRAARGPDAAAPIAAAIQELRALLTRCQAAIDDVHASADYRAARAAFTAGDVARVAMLAPSLFTAVVPRPPEGALYWPVPLGRGRGGEHFISPAECAERVRRIATEGVPAGPETPELGGDETIRPIILSEEHDAGESPIALVISGGVPAPLCRLEGSPLVLVYAQRLHAKLSVRAVADVSDEWWRIRPDAYHRYLDELDRELRARGLSLVVEP